MSDEMDEIWVLYADDGAQAMDAMESALLSLQDSAPEDQPRLVAALFRAVHTFKGNSRVLGLETVESRAHLAEDLIGLVRDQGVALDDEILSLLLETGDRLREMLEETARTRADVSPADTDALVARLRDKVDRCNGTEPALAAQDPVATHDATVANAPAPPPADIDASAIDEVSPHTPDAADAGADAQAATAPEEVHHAAPTDESTATALASDAAYLAIFDEMVADALTKLRTAESNGNISGIARILPGLAHAARQLGLHIWQELLGTLPQSPQAKDLHDVIVSIETLSRMQAPASSTSAVAPAEGAFFERITGALETISRLGVNFALNMQPNEETLTTAVDSLCAEADAEGYVRVAAAARTLPAAEDANAFRRCELRLYEELASVETALGAASLAGGISPRKLLQSWCADHVFETLDELDAVLERLRKGSTTPADHRALERLIRLVHYACVHFNLDVASDLAMSILDLFSRGHARGDRPDAILMQIARGFVDTLELVFDAVREGETPETGRLEELFREAADAGFKGAGVMTAAAIERRLGLPPEFHRVLSPESARSAAHAMEAGRFFYLLRADINADDVLAQALFDLIGTGRIEAITNVTVFEGDSTIFDFLIASELDEIALTATLAQLDPGGRNLVLLRSLMLEPESPQGATDAPETPADTLSDAIPSVEMSSEMLEQLGEVAAGQAMLQSMLRDLSDADLSETLDGVLRTHGDDLRAARQAVRKVGDQLTGQLREIAQLGTQILGHLSELQQLTATLRTRPAETIVRPLAAMVAAHSRHNGFEAQMTSTGGELTLDVSMLETLRAVLRPFLLGRLDHPTRAPRRLHLAIRKTDDQVSAILDDDGQTAPEPEQIAAVEAELARHDGSLRAIRRPEGGTRLHVFLPINLVVLEGMVVGADGTRYVLPVNAIRTILQPDPAALVPVSDQDGQRTWLRLNKDELVPVRSISDSGGRCDAGHRMGADKRPRVHVVLALPESCVAIPVDELLGQQLVLSRPLRGVMTGLASISGVALLSRGDVAMVLSPASLCAAQGETRLHGSPLTH